LSAALGLDFSNRKNRAAWLTYVMELTLNYCCMPSAKKLRLPISGSRARIRKAG